MKILAWAAFFLHMILIAALSSLIAFSMIYPMIKVYHVPALIGFAIFYLICSFNGWYAVHCGIWDVLIPKYFKLFKCQ